MAPNRNCLFAGCPKRAKVRGLCPAHYKLRHGQVRAGAYAGWRELEALGLALPPNDLGRRKWVFGGRLPDNGQKKTAAQDADPCCAR